MNRIVIHADQGSFTLNRNLYGHFAEHLGRGIYEGLWVGEDAAIPNVRGIRSDVVAALRRLRPAVLRWPGGCFADEYHWRDGIGPRAARPAMLNSHWGGVVENNHFGTHEFFDLCEQIGAEPYICGNVGSGTVREMQEWVEYCTFAGRSPLAELRRAHGREQPWRLPYFGIGNENMGCGGMMRPEYYADEYRRYQTYVRHLSGNRVSKIACGPNGANYEWTEVLMKRAGGLMDGLTLHYYAMPPWGEDKGRATEFSLEEYGRTLERCLVMDELLARHGTIMDRYDPKKRVALIVDEWGTWWEPEPGANPDFLFQQSTMRDAMVAALTLNLFHHHGARVRMANIAQTVNVLQAVVLTDGPRIVLSPTYHVFDLFQVHQDATYLPLHLAGDDWEIGSRKLPAISASASRRDGRIALSLAHTDPGREARVEVSLRGAEAGAVAGRILHAPTVQAHNTFDRPDTVRLRPFAGARLSGGRLEVTLPPASVVTLELTP
ncbi:MAG: alpha-N-arabinofuranosidase [Opitutaceae bacterium]|nr:alpha-N-arabinofuranosidase [Opitutaceae bacterium]